MEQIEIIREFVALPAIFDKRAIAAARWRKVSSCCQSRKKKGKENSRLTAWGKLSAVSASPPCPKGEIAVSMRQLVMELIGEVEGLRETRLLCMLKATLKFAKERQEREKRGLCV